MADVNGDLIAPADYSPFGVSTGLAETSYGYTGERTDPSELVYLRARYYLPQIGRFISRDTWQGDYNRPLSLNRWSYIKGNPIQLKDPSGFCSQKGWNDPQGIFTKENCDRLETGDLEITKSWYYSFADYVQNDLPQTAKNLRHYLDGSGSELQLDSSFMKNRIYGWGKLKRQVERLAIWHSKKCISDGEGCSSIKIDTAIFAKGFTPPYYQASTLWPFSKSELDISGALGSFRLDVVIEGTFDDCYSAWLWKSGETNLSLHLIVLDYYNWHKGLSVTYQGNEIQDEWAARLSNAGMASPFLVRGDLNISIQKNFHNLSFGFVSETPPHGWVNASCIGSQFDIDQEGPSQIDYCGNPMK